MRIAGVSAALAVLLAGVVACQPKPEPEAAAPPVPTSASASPTPSASPVPPAAPVPPKVEPPKVQPPKVEPPKTKCDKGEFHHAVIGAIRELGYEDTGCAGIKQFQRRYGLHPVDGIAGKATHAVAQRLLASDPARCDAGAGLTACVDLTNQTTWLMRDGEVVYGPTVTRTGMKAFATPTGYYQIDWRSLKDWSKPYKVWLPYWQSFNDDIGFHETTSYLHNPAIGSHGCVNLLHDDAVEYWERLGEGSPVHVFGHRPGT